MICPACGELVIAWLVDDQLRLLPTHPDRIEPDDDCTASLVTYGNQTA